ncbi:LANO_0D05776g1_1 [Lachancea nothofagi CBS 11611]|uniref:LANO_0D05776g1_1 n=1 Tax=Lachancea nothofagi CBS 11611 TaxID=1266666 RepID=A0A1G4JGZ5_9SACH|nr:LANO_0D05776g1_1 [Lachancea nothofagi CBS 11611]
MSNSRYAQVENGNNQRLDELANKLSTFRRVNEEIGSDARADSSVMDQLQNQFGSMMLKLKNSSSRLTRSMRAGNNIWRMIGLSLLIFFIIYALFKLF